VRAAVELRSMVRPREPGACGTVLAVGRAAVAETWNSFTAALGGPC